MNLVQICVSVKCSILVLLSSNNMLSQFREFKLASWLAPLIRHLTVTDYSNLPHS